MLKNEDFRMLGALFIVFDELIVVMGVGWNFLAREFRMYCCLFLDWSPTLDLYSLASILMQCTISIPLFFLLSSM